MEKRRDDRDARKAREIKADQEEKDENQQPAELQVGEEGERENLSRFEPDPN
jgi:hypothetical protein